MSPGWVRPTVGHCTTAAFIVLGIVPHLGFIGCTSKQVLSPSSHPLTPNPLARYPTSNLARMFEADLMHNDPEPEEVYYLDTDPQCFQHILSWLRYGMLAIPPEMDKKLVMMAAKQLGLDDLAKQLEKEAVGAKAAMTDWLKLNVGGTIFETSRATLTSHPTSSLARMFEPNSNLPPATITTDGVYLIDACPVGFSVILNWLRYRRLMLGQVKVEEVMPLADYFGLEELQGLLSKQILKVNTSSSAKKVNEGVLRNVTPVLYF